MIKKNKFESLNNIGNLAIEEGDMSTSSSSSSLDDFNDSVSPKPEKDTSLQQNVLSHKHRSVPSFSEIFNKSLNYLSTERFFSPNDILNVVQDQSLTINNGTRNFVQTLTKSGPVMKTLAFINSTGVIKNKNSFIRYNFKQIYKNLRSLKAKIIKLKLIRRLLAQKRRRTNSRPNHLNYYIT